MGTNSQIRCPEELWIWLKTRATEERRSINAHILYILEKERRRELAEAALAARSNGGLAGAAGGE